MRLRRKFVAFLSLCSLTLNIFQPVILAFTFAVPAYAQEVPESTPTPESSVAVENTPSPEPTIAPSADPSVAPSPTSSPDVTPTPAATPDTTLAPSATPTPTPSDSQPSSTPVPSDSAPAPPSPTSSPDVTPTPSPTPSPAYLDEQLHIAVIENTEASSIEEYDLEVTETGSAQLATDKLDYAPTDTALITGNGFLPNTTYSLTISSTDEPATSTTVDVTTNELGTLYYAYQLDGLYRPNYKVEAKDLEGAVIATITFTDHANFDVAINSNDPTTSSLNVTLNMSWSAGFLSGADPVVARFANDTNGGSCNNLGSGSWSAWEPIVESGSNTATKSWTLQSGANGNRKVCVQSSHSILVIFAHTLEANDEIEYGNIQHTPVTFCHATPPDTAANGYEQITTDDDGILQQGHGSEHDADIIPPFTYYAGSFPGKNWTQDGQAIYNNGCVVPSSTLTVTKVVVPSTDSGLFNLTIDGTTYANNIGNGGTTGAQIVSAGVHTVGETAGTDTNLANYTATFSGDCNAQGQVTVGVGQNKSCTITNTRNTGTLRVRKNVDLNGDGDYFDNGETGNTSWNWQYNGGTDIATGTSAITVPTGDYVLSETQKPGFHFVSLSCTGGSLDTDTNTVTVVKDANVLCTFVNARDTGTITIIKDSLGDHSEYFRFDTNFDTSSQSGNQTIFYLRDNQSKVVTVPTGEYWVDEASEYGWQLTGLTCTGDTGENTTWDQTTQRATIGLETGENIVCTFTNTQLAKVWGFKYHDVNTNGYWNPLHGEQGLSNWHITITGPNEFEDDTYTSSYFLSRGYYQFTGLMPGDYTICEEMQAGWTNITPLCQNVHLTPGDVDHFIDFGNAHQGDLEVTKYNDVNGNGQLDKDESVLGGWEITLDDLVQTTATGSGKANFNNLETGWHTLDETMQDGWTQTNISCEEDEEESEESDERVSGNVYVNPGQTTYCTIGNQMDPKLTIEKSNDVTGAQSPGSDVVYTLKVELSGSNVNGVKVVDTTPTGFTYRAGSWTANSSVRGNLAAVAGITEPTYASPGTWTLGDMVVGEIVTLTYAADISNSVDSGTYKDIAWAYGSNSFDESEVLSVGQNSQYVEGIFVGTDVEIKKDTQQTGSVNLERTGEVLGVSTELPATGADTIWIILAIALFLLGSVLIFGGKIMSKLFVALLIAISIFSVVPTVSAVEPAKLSIRMETPLSPTRISDWTLSFSALDRDNSQITVKCYVKKTSGDFVQFDVDKVLSHGGASSCQVNGSVLSNQGTYSFKVVASSPNGEAVSSTAQVVYDTEGPGTPNYYSKEHPSLCRWVIKFHTADDNGATTKVEIYSSKDKNFDTHAGTRVGTVDIGSNLDGQFIHDRANECDKEWYYAIRAYDSTGNQSGYRGDEFVVNTVTSTPTASPVGAKIVLTSGSVLGQDNSAESGEVMGEEAPIQAVEEEVNTGASDTATPVTKNKFTWWILTTIIALGIIYGVARKKISN